jgi:hypothetical protein
MQQHSQFHATTLTVPCNNTHSSMQQHSQFHATTLTVLCNNTQFYATTLTVPCNNTHSSMQQHSQFHEDKSFFELTSHSVYTQFFKHLYGLENIMPRRTFGPKRTRNRNIFSRNMTLSQKKLRTSTEFVRK